MAPIQPYMDRWNWKAKKKKQEEINIVWYYFFTCHQCQNMSILILSTIFFPRFCCVFLRFTYGDDWLTYLVHLYILTAWLDLIIDTKGSMLMCDICFMCFNSVRIFLYLLRITIDVGCLVRKLVQFQQWAVWSHPIHLNSFVHPILIPLVTSLLNYILDNKIYSIFNHFTCLIL